MAFNVNETVAKAISVAKTKKEFLVRQGVNTILLFVILMIFGCLDFATLTFHIEYLAQASYWATTGTKVVSGVCAFNIGINFAWDIELNKNEILTKLIQQYDKLMTYKQLDFEYFVMKVFNPTQKKKAYLSMINRKIYKLNRFSRAKDRLLYSSDLPEKQELKLKNRYCIKRQELEDLKKDDYINKNLDNIIINYNEVDPAVFELEIDGSAKYTGIKTKGNATLGKAKASSSMVLAMVGISMFTTAIALDMNKEEFASQMESFWHYCLKCVTDVGVILWQVLKGANKTKHIISESYTEPYAGRIKVLTEYLEWRLKTQQPNSLAFEELTKDEVIVELTEDDLLKLKGETSDEKEKINIQNKEQNQVL